MRAELDREGSVSVGCLGKLVLMTLSCYHGARQRDARGAGGVLVTDRQGDKPCCPYLFTCCSLRVTFIAERFF